MMVVFFDTNDNVVPYPPSSYETLGSVILDSVGAATPYDMILPPAVDATGWVYLQADQHVHVLSGFQLQL